MALELRARDSSPGNAGTVTLNLYRLPNLYRAHHPYVIHSKPACQQMIASSVAGQVSKNIRAHVA
jgi:hypothetical protein